MRLRRSGCGLLLELWAAVSFAVLLVTAVSGNLGIVSFALVIFAGYCILTGYLGRAAAIERSREPLEGIVLALMLPFIGIIIEGLLPRGQNQL